MTFTRKDAEALQAAREKVAQLEEAEREALKSLSVVLREATGGAWDLATSAKLARSADSIRDALLPFDSGVRPKLSEIPAAPSSWPPPPVLPANPVGPWGAPNTPEASRTLPWGTP